MIDGQDKNQFSIVSWLKHNVVLVIFIIAIFASFAAAKSDGAERDRRLVAAAVSVCERTSSGTAYDIVFKFRVAADARAQGKVKYASDIESYARGKLRTLPAPPNLGNKERSLRRMTSTTHLNGRIVLTKEAADLQELGCKTLFN